MERKDAGRQTLLKRPILRWMPPLSPSLFSDSSRTYAFHGPSCTHFLRCPHSPQKIMNGLRRFPGIVFSLRSNPNCKKKRTVPFIHIAKWAPDSQNGAKKKRNTRCIIFFSQAREIETSRTDLWHQLSTLFLSCSLGANQWLLSVCVRVAKP